MFLAAALTTALAWGQGATAFSQVGSVFRPADLEWGLGETVGSPSVVTFDPYDVGFNAKISLLVYETQVEGPSTECPAGKWGVGMAFRLFGDNASLYEDLGPIVEPTAGTYYSCVAAHPTIVELSDVQVSLGQSWLVYFKAEQDCTGQGASCERYTGVGRMVVSYDVFSIFSPFLTPTFAYTAADATPVLTGVAQDMGYPRAAFVNGKYRLAFGQFPDVYLASSPLTNSFSVSPSPVLTAGTPATWGDDELSSPSILCEGSSTLKMYPMGRSWDLSPSILTDQSVGLFQSTSPGTDFDSFTEVNAAPYFSTSDGDLEMRHVHMSSASSYTSYGLFYSTPVGGGNEVRVATTSGFDWRNIDSRRCP